MARKTPKLSAFWREDESNQQLSRLNKIERILIFGRTLIGGFIYAKDMALLAFRSFLH